MTRYNTGLKYPTMIWRLQMQCFEARDISMLALCAIKQLRKFLKHITQVQSQRQLRFLIVYHTWQKKGTFTNHSLKNKRILLTK